MGVDESGEYERIRLLVRRRRGVDLVLYRASYVRRRIRARMRALRAASPADYARILSEDPEETGRLLGAISTKVTSFFRNPGLYTYIEARLLPELLPERKHGQRRTGRFWSAGCATGEEAYSLSALLLGWEEEHAVNIKVLGTDVDPTAIATAKAGRYPLSALRRVPADLQRRRFRIDADGKHCRVNEEMARITSFRVESLISPPPAGAFDLILCRNVFIYFDPALQQKILAQLASALRPGGYLALGRVERITGAARSLFEPVHVRERVYRRL